MSKLCLRNLLVTAAALAMFTDSSSAQTAPTQPTQPVTITLTIPFTLSKLDARITNLGAVCRLRVQNVEIYEGHMAPPTALYIPLSGFSKAPDGTISGTLTRTFTVNVPLDAGGKPGSYMCFLAGQGASVGAGLFLANRTDVFRNVAAPDSVWGALTW
jgi:hypothetical protein